MTNYDQTTYFGRLYPESTKAIIMIHGRGSDGADIANSLEGRIPITDFFIVAPNATNNTWYPYSFLAPQAQNEPELSGSLELIKELLEDLKETGYQSKDIYLLGFSQGACLALEFAARNAQIFGGIFALSGGLIGESIDPSLYSGNFEQTPIFLGCSDIDSHIPLERVKNSSILLKEMGAAVIEKIYPRMGHTINGDEIEQITKILSLDPGNNK